jgi:hypothetical protein
MTHPRLLADQRRAATVAPLDMLDVRPPRDRWQHVPFPGHCWEISRGTGMDTYVFVSRGQELLTVLHLPVPFRMPADMHWGQMDLLETMILTRLKKCGVRP